MFGSKHSFELDNKNFKNVVNTIFHDQNLNQGEKPTGDSAFIGLSKEKEAIVFS